MNMKSVLEISTMALHPVRLGPHTPKKSHGRQFVFGRNSSRCRPLRKKSMLWPQKRLSVSGNGGIFERCFCWCILYIELSPDTTLSELVKLKSCQVETNENHANTFFVS